MGMVTGPRHGGVGDNATIFVSENDPIYGGIINEQELPETLGPSLPESLGHTTERSLPLYVSILS